MHNDKLNLLGLKDFLKQRSISLNLEEFDQKYAESLDQAKTRRILWYLVLAASNTCQNGGEIYLISTFGNRSARVSCRIADSDVLAVSNSHLSISLLRQLVDQVGGGAQWVFDSDATPLTISCLMPVTNTSIVCGKFAAINR